MPLPRVGQSTQGLERLASSLGTAPDRLLVLVRVDGRAAILEVDSENRLRHVLLADVSERIARKFWGEVREGHLPHVVSIPRIPPLRGIGRAFPEEDDRRRIALGLLAISEEGLTGRQLFELRAADRDRLLLWQRSGFIRQAPRPMGLSRTLYDLPHAHPPMGKPKPIVLEPTAARYELTPAGHAEWERLENLHEERQRSKARRARSRARRWP